MAMNSFFREGQFLILYDDEMSKTLETSGGIDFQKKKQNRSNV